MSAYVGSSKNLKDLKDARGLGGCVGGAAERERAAGGGERVLHPSAPPPTHAWVAARLQRSGAVGRRRALEGGSVRPRKVGLMLNGNWGCVINGTL